MKDTLLRFWHRNCYSWVMLANAGHLLTLTNYKWSKNTVLHFIDGISFANHVALFDKDCWSCAFWADWDYKCMWCHLGPMFTVLYRFVREWGCSPVVDGADGVCSKCPRCWSVAIVKADSALSKLLHCWLFLCDCDCSAGHRALTVMKPVIMQIVSAVLREKLSSVQVINLSHSCMHTLPIFRLSLATRSPVL